MKPQLIVVLGLSILGITGAVAPTALSAQDAWTTLFDGSNLEGWEALGDANWALGDGAVSADSGSGFLVSEESYGDFELTLEFWVDTPANSGIFIRCADPGQIRDTNCYEVNIFDTRPDQTYRTGGIVHIAAPTSVIDAGGQWNSYEIRAEGPRLRVSLNGTQIVDAQDGQFTEGPIALQYGAGTVRFRNVRVRSLD